MADKSQRTEKPTAKHRRETREEGNVARSAELGGWASFLLVASLLPKLGSAAADRVTGFMHHATQAMGHPDPGTAVTLLGQGLETAAFTVLPILLIGGGLAVAIAVAQVGLRFTPKAMRMKFSRISPKSGLKRLYSSQGFWTLGKTLLKLAMLASVGYVIMRRLVGGVLGGGTLPLQVTLSAAASTLANLMRVIGALALALAGVDYYFQRRTYQQELRMSRQDIKDEQRESDGSPEMRRAIRSKARRLSRQRMMAAIATADVVVTNPTHFAVAIAYDRNKDRAPRVVAKGADFNAVAIRERARSCNVAIVENPSLARALHASCEIDDVVPPQLYAAVAQLLAFVYSLSPTARAFREVHQMSG
ncbi:EscU/YscU/HrcU family type III secretion system export apparatus switch protein [bacterium]|nr:MAG: EscU/YscU/HrcU family type III secretion system export apparatus switch protein [bacterium]